LEIEGETHSIHWEIDENTFISPYETVTVSGTTDRGLTVKADVLIIPPAAHPLVYFVDSGRGGDSLGNPPSDSPFYEAVKQLTGGSLINQLPDQRYVAGQTTWGFDD